MRRMPSTFSRRDFLKASGAGLLGVFLADLRQDLAPIEGLKADALVHAAACVDFDAGLDELLRVIDSMQLTAKHKVATPVNWKQGEDVIIVASLKDEDAKKVFPDGWKAVKPYLRVVPQPRG